MDDQEGAEKQHVHPLQGSHNYTPWLVDHGKARAGAEQECAVVAGKDLKESL